MAANIYDLSTTAASNTTIDGTDVSGTTGKVKDGDNVMRSLGAYMAQFADDLGGVTTVGGTANAMTVTAASGYTSYVNGQMFSAVVTTANTATMTINVNAIGAKTVKKYDSTGTLVALAANDNLPGLRHYTYLSSPDAIVLLNPGHTRPIARFKAHKNGTDQTTVSSATHTKVTFGTEAFDVGSYFASSTWTPPAVPVHLHAQASFSGTLSSAGAALLSIYKNGSVFASSVDYQSSAAENGLQVSCTDEANGTDTYEVYIFLTTSAGTGTVNGQSYRTFFEGHTMTGAP